MSDQERSSSNDSRRQLERIVEEYLDAIDRGESPDQNALIEANPELQQPLLKFFRNPDSFETQIDRQRQHNDDTVTHPVLDDATIPPGQNVAGSSETEAQTLGSREDASQLANSQVGLGTKFFGDYELIEEIARGGMGVVYRARQSKLKRVVALKMILSGSLAGEDDVKRFQAEAEAAATLDHPGIVPIYEIGENQGQHFFSMAFVEGKSLAEKVSNGPLPTEEAVRYVELIADAIGFAHQHGVIHRDLKPANIIIDSSGHPKVTDFGLAKRVEGGSDLTETGQVLGTPSYMPPEQASGSNEQVTESADIYSLGAVLFSLTTGRPPFQSSNPVDTLIQVLEEEPVAPRVLNPTVGRDLEIVCLKCLQKSPVQRYATVLDLRDDLKRIRLGQPIVARPVSRLERALRWSRKNPGISALWGAVAVLVATLAIGGPLVALQQVGLRQQANRAEQQRGEAQVDGLLSAAPGSVPIILENIEKDYADLLPYLRRMHESESTLQGRTRLSMALKQDNRIHVEFLEQQLTVCPAAEFPLIRQAITPPRKSFVDALWSLWEDTGANPAERFRAACALAGYDPHNSIWEDIAPTVADYLARQDSFSTPIWTNELRPVKAMLTQPLSNMLDDDSAATTAARVLATSILADYAKDNPEQLVDLLILSNEQSFNVFLEKIESHQDAASQILSDRIAQLRQSDESLSRDHRLANAAIACIHLGDSDEVWSLLRFTPQPLTRSYMIRRIPIFGVPVSKVIEHLLGESDPGIIQGLLLTLGGYHYDSLDDQLKSEVETTIRECYLNTRHGSIHSAAGWLLRKWNLVEQLQDMTAELEAVGDQSGNDWFVRSGTRFIVLAPRRFMMGSPNPEEGRRDDETSHERRIAGTFAIATNEVTVAEFRNFLDVNERSYLDFQSVHSPDPNCPQTSLTWFDAAEYCNWLSEQEGLPPSEWCFVPNDEDQYTGGMKLADDYLRRRGYRLPTEAEWEFACRGGAEASRFFGDDPQLLVTHAWYLSNANDRSWPVRTLHPNQFGIFDMYGNVWEWCADEPVDYPKSATNVDDFISNYGPVKDVDPRSLRGGSYFYHPIYLRSALRNREPAGARYFGVGMRLVRSMPDREE